MWLEAYGQAKRNKGGTGRGSSRTQKLDIRHSIKCQWGASDRSYTPANQRRGTP